MVKLNEEVVIDNINVFQVSSVIWALIKNPVKESFYGKRKKKVINILTVFFISYKNDVKIFFNWILNQYPKDTR